jgi:hypothetical protein
MKLKMGGSKLCGGQQATLLAQAWVLPLNLQQLVAAAAVAAAAAAA